jgi:hypothetical protein
MTTRDLDTLRRSIDQLLANLRPLHRISDVRVERSLSLLLLGLLELGFALVARERQRGSSSRELRRP